MWGLSSLRVGETSKAEAFPRVPGLRELHDEDGKKSCSADECLSAQTPPSWVSNPLIWSSRKGYQDIYAALHCWGTRYWGLDPHVDVASGKVAGFGYRIIRSTPILLDPGILSASPSTNNPFRR